MKQFGQRWICAGIISLLVACGGGGGGGDRAPGVDPGPPPPGGSVPPPTPEVPAPNPAPYAEAEAIFPVINSVTIPADGRPVVDFQLTDGNATAILDLEASNVRFIISKLQGSPLGNLTGSWQSYINRIEQAGSVGPGTEPKLQATTESDGEFTNFEDGNYRYRFATAITDLPDDILDQADQEDLDLVYLPERTHRVAIQFSGAQVPANPIYDWVPSTGATEGIFRYDVSATANCNNCHDPLAFHGGGRIEMPYCSACHNPGSTDANSGNSVDMKVMTHKIHMGANLPSVQAGGRYVIWGFNDSEHDYSNLRYSQDIRRCENCHAGTETGTGRDDLQLTDQGDNWAYYSTRAACGSCHDLLDWDRHAGGQPDDSRCGSCHSEGGRAGSIQFSHRMLMEEARAAFDAQILAVDSTAPGEMAQVTFKVSNPLTGEDYDIQSHPVFTDSSINVKLAWNTTDYTNTGNQGDSASSISANAAGATNNGDGSFTVAMPIAVPDGTLAPGVAASGSGAATVEGRLSLVLEEGAEPTSVPVGDTVAFFSIDEPDGTPVARRTGSTIEQCNACHGSLILHGSNRADNLDSCVTCHNPRNTDLRQRLIAQNPPTDGKREESVDMKTMIHGIHAAAMREEPLQIVGFRGFTTHVYDEEHVHYPGNLGNCLACHNEDGYQLPLADGVLATTIDTGEDIADRSDDTVVTPATAACASCHDDAVARAHMTSNGGSFATTQAAIDEGEIVEQCSVCHAPGRSSDVSLVHPVQAKR